MKNNDILTIQEIKELIKPIMEEYEINDYYLFGSYARSTATPESDVDIYCVKGKIRTFLDQMEFEDKLQKVLNKKVDIIFNTAKVDEFFEAEIKKDLIKL